MKLGAVIRCAAITEFNRIGGSLAASNIMGTKYMAALAADANAMLYHVSIAFADTAAGSLNGMEFTSRPAATVAPGMGRERLIAAWAYTLFARIFPAGATMTNPQLLQRSQTRVPPHAGFQG